MSGTVPHPLGIPTPPPTTEKTADVKVDYFNLPRPVAYEEIQREAFCEFYSILFAALLF